eukprot:5334023-Prymnesium_polylepis.1
MDLQAVASDPVGDAAMGNRGLRSAARGTRGPLRPPGSTARRSPSAATRHLGRPAGQLYRAPRARVDGRLRGHPARRDRRAPLVRDETGTPTAEAQRSQLPRRRGSNCGRLRMGRLPP